MCGQGDIASCVWKRDKTENAKGLHVVAGQVGDGVDQHRADRCGVIGAVGDERLSL